MTVAQRSDLVNFTKNHNVKLTIPIWLFERPFQALKSYWEEGLDPAFSCLRRQLGEFIMSFYSNTPVY